MAEAGSSGAGRVAGAAAGAGARVAVEAAAASGRSLPVLRHGMVVEAAVLERLGGGNWRIALGGREIVVESRVELPVGSVVSLAVRAVGAWVEMALVGPAEGGSLPSGGAGAWLPILGRALEALVASHRSGGGEVLQAGLQGLLEGLRHGPLSAAALRALHQGLGLLHEARVAGLGRAAPGIAEELRGDLKARALAAVDGAGEGNEERGVLRALLAALDGFQVEQARRAAADGTQWLPLSVLPGGWIREGAMLVRRARGEEDPAAGRENAGARRPFHVVLLLDLRRLGPVRADLALAGAEATVRIRASRAASVRRLAAEQARLAGALEAAGLRVAGLSVEHARGEDLAREEVLGAALLPPEGLVDVRA